MIYRSSGVGMAIVALLLMAASLPAATTVWDFNSADLVASSGHAVMSYRDAATQSNTSFGTTDGTIVPNIEGQNVNYMAFPVSNRSQGFDVARAGYAPTLTAYTLLWDILVPTSDYGTYNYMGIFNTDPVGNSDAELMFDLRAATEGQMFVDRDRDNGKVYTQIGDIDRNTWHRVVFAYDENHATEDVRVFVDGVKVGASDEMFGELGLRLPGTFPMFQDGGSDSVEHAPGLVASAALVERVMTDAEISTLGGPKASGFASIYDPGIAAPGPPAGTNNYATALAATNPLVYLPLNEAPGKVATDPVQNDGSLVALAATWGIAGSSYTNTVPESGAEGPNPSWTAAGQPLVGFETGNLAAKFRGRYPGNANADMLDLGANPTDLDLETVTWSFWMNSGDTNDASNTHKYLITTPGGTSFSNLLVVAMTSSSEIKIITDGTAATTPNEAVTTGLQIADSQWHHIVVVRNGEDAANTKLYVDGVAVSLTTTDESPATRYNYRIGARGSNTDTYTGWLDEIACWDRELSSAEVTKLFNAAISVPEPSSLALLLAMFMGGLAGSRRRQ